MATFFANKVNICKLVARTAVAIGLVLAGAASAAAQGYDPPTPALPPQVDTSLPGPIAIPPADPPAPAHAPSTATAPSADTATAKPKESQSSQH
jgi:hypothetical protein